MPHIHTLSKSLLISPKGKETPAEEKEKFVWRMHQPTEPRKYQLFPAKDKLQITAGRKSPDPETVFAVAMGHSGTAEKERSLLGNALRIKVKEPPLIRRRKVSVPELGPMTTVQEVAMDSREYLVMSHIHMKLKEDSHNTRPPSAS